MSLICHSFLVGLQNTKPEDASRTLVSTKKRYLEDLKAVDVQNSNVELLLLLLHGLINTLRQRHRRQRQLEDQRWTESKT